jgi:ABC-type Fe3+ transport system substrate-binding protein
MAGHTRPGLARAFAAALTAAAIASTAHTAEMSPAMKTLVAAAEKEGEIVLTFGEGAVGGVEGARKIEAKLNEVYGTKIKVTYTPGPSMPAMASQISMLQAAKQPSPTDVYVGWSRHMPSLHKRKALLPVDWKGLLPGRVDDRIVEFDGTMVKIVTSIPGVFYNTKLAPFRPERMTDFLKPEWKGKIASTTYSANFDVLAGPGMWGPEKAIDYAKKLSGQIAGLVRCNESERISSGEFLAMVPNCAGRDVEDQIRKGAPIANLTPHDFLVKNYTYLAVPKNAVHPSAGTLFIAFILTPEGQAILWDTWGSDLDLFPETHLHAEVAKIEAHYGERLMTADATWQLGNDSGNKAWSEINKILSTR